MSNDHTHALFRCAPMTPRVLTEEWGNEGQIDCVTGILLRWVLLTKHLVSVKSPNGRAEHLSLFVQISPVRVYLGKPDFPVKYRSQGSTSTDRNSVSEITILHLRYRALDDKVQEAMFLITIFISIAVFVSISYTTLWSSKCWQIKKQHTTTTYYSESSQYFISSFRPFRWATSNGGKEQVLSTLAGSLRHS